MAPQTFAKVDLTPKRYHGYAVLLFILGTLFPPLAVAARFGIGKDFWLNVILTICGYIPGHVHNFYIQNVRNNKNHRRTPKWIQKYGLVNTHEIKRKERRSQWAGRYSERLPHSALDEQPYEEGQDARSNADVSLENGDARRRNENGDYWSPQEEHFYGESNKSSPSVRSEGSGRWHYPANFEDAIEEPSRKKSSRRKKDKKDRWARTEDAYSMNDAPTMSRRKKSKKHHGTTEADTYSTRSDSTGGNEFPEDAEGGLYGETRHVPEQEAVIRRQNEDDIFTHEF
ncbi:hypothetical protein EIP86_000454 [Pleurotus ostreatoroseus]|nr:hypothetical protein EIP86_000454 [Pleurotus ostreatoroseus]